MHVLFIVTEWMLPVALVCCAIGCLVAVVREPTILSWCLLVTTLCLSGSVIVGWLAYGEFKTDLENTGGVVRVTPQYSMLIVSKILMIIALGAAIVGSLVYTFQHRKPSKGNAG